LIVCGTPPTYAIDTTGLKNYIPKAGKSFAKSQKKYLFSWRFLQGDF
jgi:hypothetical protein